MDLYRVEGSSTGEYGAFFDDVFRVLGNSIVPYSLEERKKTHARAFEELDRYVKRWQAIVALKVRAPGKTAPGAE